MIPFVSHPEIIAAVSVVFFICYFGVCKIYRSSLSWRTLPILICAVMWAIFTLWEIYCETMGANIRVDLFFIGPALIVTSIVSLILSVLGLLSYITKRS